LDTLDLSISIQRIMKTGNAQTINRGPENEAPAKSLINGCSRTEQATAAQPKLNRTAIRSYACRR
jgi:hypothetical protein